MPRRAQRQRREEIHPCSWLFFPSQPHRPAKIDSLSKDLIEIKDDLVRDMIAAVELCSIFVLCVTSRDVERRSNRRAPDNLRPDVVPFVMTVASDANSALTPQSGLSFFGAHAGPKLKAGNCEGQSSP
jgi:hypothetical protein